MLEDYEESISVDPEDKEFKETIKKARVEIENTNGSRHALQEHARKARHGETRSKI